MVRMSSEQEVLNLIRKLSDGNHNISDAERISAFCKLMQMGKIHTFAYVLPLLLNLDGKPYTLKNHYQFEPVFRTRRPKKLLLFAGRQVSKTTTEAADGIIQANCIPNFKILYVTPLFEQVRRLSTDRVGRLIEQSPVRHLWVSTKTENSVLRKSFTNFSTMYFSYALLDAERIRGITADKVCFDEVQDMVTEHLPIITETMSHSQWGWTQYAGTPKTFENTIHGLWLSSSRAEWFIPCKACKHDNICSSEFDLLKIIGPVYDPGTDPFFGTVCAKCSRHINPADGFWVHRHPERRWDFAGYHIPQPIMHIHYSRPDKWAELLAKREGFGNYTPAKFFNEVLGESCGTGVQLISAEELQRAACLPWSNNPNDPSEAISISSQYFYRVLAVDWGGGGKAKGRSSEVPISLTALAILGYLPDGQIHVIWGRRLMTPHDHMGEAEYCLEIFNKFRCHYLTHDYTGAGSLRETLLVHNRVPLERIIPMAYIGAAKGAIMRFKPATDIHPRAHFLVDKTRSLLLTCASIKLQKVKFFKYDYVSPDNPGLIHDFLGLVENKVPTATRGDIYTIQRHAHLPDDFAQAVNMGCCALWYKSNSWPAFRQEGDFVPREDQWEEIDPSADEAYF